MNKLYILFASLCIVVIFTHFSDLQAKSIFVYNIDASSFPIIQANFIAVDRSGKQYLDFDKSTFAIKENNIDREILYVSCPSEPKAVALSTVLVIDVSGSMIGFNLEIAKAAANAYIDGMGIHNSECAITTFSSSNYLIQDFTIDRELLKQKVDAIKIGGGTNYDAGFIDKPAGGLQLTKNANLKKVIIFLSDGLPNFPPSVDRIVNEALAQNVTIYTVTIGLKSPAVLKTIAEKTGGMWFESVNSIEVIEDIYRKIQSLAEGSEPCSIAWKSGIPCSVEESKVELNEYSKNLKTSFSYFPPPDAVPILEFNPKSVLFKRIPPGVSKDSTITIKAINQDFENIEIFSDNSVFTVSPNKFSLKKNETKILTINFTPTDSAYTYCRFLVETNLCNSKFYASGGFPGKKPKQKTIKLNRPDGGEKFVVGSDESISWSGIPEGDTVSLKYSTDNGLIWNNITDKASNLKYNWKNIPNTPSNRCLMKVIQLAQESDDSRVHYLGDTGEDSGNGIAFDYEGNMYFAGSFSGSVDFGGQALTSSGRSDIFIAKFGIDGFLEWVTKEGTLNDDGINSLKIDPAGNIYVTGYADFNDNGGSDIFFAKYDKKGQKIFSVTSGSIFDVKEEGKSITFDNLGNSYITGCFGGEAQFGDSIIKSTGALDVFITKYNNKGEMQWIKTAGAQVHNDCGNGIEISNYGNIYVTGTFQGIIDFEGNFIQSNGLDDVFIAKYSKDGAFEWAKNTGGIYNDNAAAVALDPYESIYIAGNFAGTAYIAGNALVSAGDNDIFIAKYRFDGIPQWSLRAGGNSNDLVKGMVFDEYGAGFITGSFNGNASFGNYNVNSNGAEDVFIAEFNHKGKFEWAKSAGGSNSETGNGIFTDYTGLVYSIGNYKGTSKFGNQNIKSLGQNDIFIWSVGREYLQDDVSDNLWSIVVPKLSSKNVDMGKQYINQTKDTNVFEFVRNISSYASRIDTIFIQGNDASNFRIVIDEPPYNLDAGKSKNVGFLFIPDRIGIHNAQIVIVTQVDTLVQQISGQGIDEKFEVVNNLIDFGKIFLGESKDSLQAVTIKNIGKTSVMINKISLDSLNLTDFRILSDIEQVNLKPGDTIKLDLRFEPNNEGRTNGMINFYFNDIGSPAKVQLFGEATNYRPRLIYQIGDYSNLICNNTQSIELEIKNIGGSNLMINNVETSGNDKDLFIVNNFTKKEIEPDSNYKVNIDFYSEIPGNFSCELLIKSNNEPDSIIKIPVSIKKDVIGFSVDKDTIDLGYLCPEETAGFKIIITNAGTLDLVLNSTKSENIDLIDDFDVINVNNAKEIEFKFNGLSNEGLFVENIMLIDTICNYEKDIVIKGIVQIPSVKIESDTLVSEIFKKSVSKIILTNTSDREINIINEPILLKPYELMPGQFPIKIMPGKLVSIEYEFYPEDNKLITLPVEFQIDECKKIVETFLTGKGQYGASVIEIGSAEGNPGEIVEIPLIIHNIKDLLDAGVTELDLTVETNSTLLYPEFTKDFVTDFNILKFNLKNIDIKSDSNEIRLMLPFTVGLGNTDSTELVIVDYKTNREDFDFVTINGKFKLTGICYEGGKRLLNPNNVALISSIKPNPAANNLKIEVVLKENYNTKLLMTDINGEIIMSIFDNVEIETGTHTFNVNLSKLGSGNYFLKLITPTNQEIKKVIIIK